MPRFFEAVCCARSVGSGGLEAAVLVPQRLRSTGDGRWWWSDDQLGEPAQVLCDGRERKLILRTARATKPKATKFQDALEMSE